MEIRREHRGATLVVSLAGEFNIYEAVAAKAPLLAPLAEADELEMDLAGVNEIDSAGVQLLILAKREAAAAGKRLQFTSHSRAVVELLELYGLAAWFGDPLVLPAETPSAGEQP